MKYKNTYLKSTSIEYYDFDEQNYELSINYIPNYDEDEDDVWKSLVFVKNNSKIKNTPIHIDKLISALNTLKELGSNYVSLFYHTDHDGYEIEGHKIEYATEDEIAEYEDKVKKMNKLQDTYNKLLKKIKKCEKKYDKIKRDL